MTLVLPTTIYQLPTAQRFFAGGHRGVVTPVPIPNTEVKGSIAEGSAGLARARVGRCRLFFALTGKKRRHRPTAAPPLARPSGSASPRGIRRQFFFKKLLGSYAFVLSASAIICSASTVPLAPRERVKDVEIPLSSARRGRYGTGVSSARRGRYGAGVSSARCGRYGVAIPSPIPNPTTNYHLPTTIYHLFAVSQTV